MSEERWSRPPEDHDFAPGKPEPSPSEPEPSPADDIPPAVAAQPASDSRSAATFRQTALWLAALLVLVIAGLAMSPFWAPAVAPLLPWSAKPVPMAIDYSKLATRADALEERPAPSATDFSAIKSTLALQAQRIDLLEAATAASGGNQASATANKAALQQLTERVAASEARSETQAAEKTTAAAKAEQELGQLGATVTDLADRLSALEQRVRAQGSSDRTGTALLLAVLQIRDGVETGRPFPAAYGAFDGLARSDPALIAAAAPLGQAARDGVASRAMLRRQLADLAEKAARVTQPSGKLKWWEQALDRIKRLVTIRRIGAAPHDSPEATISTAQSALAVNDLATAVSVIGSLDGSDADAARQWLQMARGRLAAEAALTHLQELLAARLGAVATPPAVAPGANPAPPPTTAHAPS